MRTSVHPEASFWERTRQPAAEAAPFVQQVWPVAPDVGVGAIWPVEAHFGAGPFRPHPRDQMRGPAARIYLVAVEREDFPPVALGNSILQRMRVTLVPPDCSLEAAGASPVAVYSAGAPARSVRGEILRDNKGKYYEKIGSFVRELEALEASPEGDLVEVGRRAANETAPAPSRKLFPDPGQRRVVRWGEFKSIIAAQIRHPERLRDDHRLACDVQVVEVRLRELATDLAQSVFGDAGMARSLFLLSPEAAVRLELTSLLPAARSQPDMPRERGVVLPGERLFLLRVAGDPTADAAPAEPQRKRQIPEPFASQSPMRTRDEALLEMRTHAGLAARLRNWVRSLFSGGRFDRWQRTLWGKSPDEQLWALTPPSGILSDPALREWAAATLEAAGYDVAEMLREWEIYWRRRSRPGR